MAWKLNKRALRRQRALQAQQTPENKPAEKEELPLVKQPAGKVISQDFPAGNVSDIKRTSLFLHGDHGKATKAWWSEAKGLAA